MPISPNVLFERQASAGRVKIGRLSDKEVQKRSGRGSFRPPQKLNYFLITKNVRGTSDENFVVDTTLMDKLKLFADEDGRLRRLPIMLDSDDIDEVFPTTLASYVGKSLSCRGTGEGKNAATRFEIIDNARVGKRRDCPCERLGARKDPVCKPNGTLWFTIVAGEETRIGVRHAFRTTSWNSVRAIGAGLRAIQRTVGTICGFRLWLVYEEQEARTREGDFRKIPTVRVELRTEDIMSLQRHAIESAQIRLRVLEQANRPMKLGLPAPASDQETSGEQSVVQQEWYPDAEYDEGEGEDDEVVYDNDTGEVVDAESTPRAKSGEYPAVGAEPVTGKPSQRQTDTALPAVGDETIVEEVLSPQTDPEPEGSPLRQRIARSLEQVIRIKGKDPRDQKWRKLLFAEACRETLGGREVVWKQATTDELEKIDDYLVGIIERAPLPSEGQQTSLVEDGDL